MEPTFDYINGFLEQLFAHGPIWIYLTLLAASFIENVFPPFPGDFFTLAGGALAATGWLNIFLVFGVVYLGGIVSTVLVYQLGYKYGRNYFIKKNYAIFSSKDIISLENWFQRRGVLLLIISRFVVGGRAVIALISGIGRYERSRFVLFISISFWIFNGILLFSSHIFVVNFKTIAEYFHTYEIIVWPLLAIVILVLIIRKIIKVKKHE